MTTSQFLLRLAALCLVLVAAAVTWTIVRRNARARRELEALANWFGLERKPTETDEELRERMRSTLRVPPRFTREDIRVMVKDALWGHGYRRVEVVLSEPAFGHVHAHAKASVPEGVLRVIERELGERIPLTMCIELSAEDGST